ncbi:MAG: sodium/proton-translocating pyrophosphatase, partial [Proteobacteria bacterium]|nr:sodium/proton-translocating pyrophosphatase [Pseudomonadota bacterium]
MCNLINLAPGIAVLGLVIAGVIYASIKKQPEGNDTMKEIATLIHDGAMTYLKRQNTILIAVIVLVALLLGAFININTSIAYVFGAISSMIAGFFGMKAATRANVRTAEAANLHKPSSAMALATAFFGGSVMGLSVASLGLLGVGVLFILFGNPETASVINGFAMGASTIALFARVGGGIYTKTADVGADLVGKV